MATRMKERIYALACALGLHHVARRLNRRKLLIVVYHGVQEDGAEDNRSWLLLPSSELRRQLQYLQRNYRILDIDEAVRQLRADALEEPTACITFDDGYRNNAQLALPLLHE